ncbi:MAG: nickel import ATP-binding protein NikD [Candidatus Epulonipiscioides saccharophilum]|nr:MAG: nickel import ATP-binding protein NikD [Epulopiscium sp. AS2M-Bin001]
MEILSIKDLEVEFKGKNKVSKLINGVSFSINKGECLCIVGESGSGKTITMKAIMGLLDHNFKINGSAKLGDIELLQAKKEDLRKIRGKQMTMILQNPMVCFDSLYRIGYQMKETFKEHTNWPKDKIHNTCIETLKKMQISKPEDVLKKYPHQLSGGMLQRIMIGIALTLNPDILIADEPTTAIDSVTQHEIMKEFVRLKNEGVTMIFITHDLAVASMISDKVVVMNKGLIVDTGTFQEIKDNPKDEYTKQLVLQKKAVTNAFKQKIGGHIA